MILPTQIITNGTTSEYQSFYLVKFSKTQGFPEGQILLMEVRRKKMHKRPMNFSIQSPGTWIQK
jgi:hypothetical protein